ncbi:ribonuclease P protein component [Pseudoxanthomonas daejeonensis]|uniref:Ribonuclease P protein component n=1 Tax=Pseudoxanthomonas daejeonensis TaxID=266062 RepID=A0ABQ6ZC07_9GAMM|nr:ribonuclease P protein component [Pseudoxanthomonas daejeonensis]KAF1697573.1 ribonuclease P protein component [Pseudoxanthomonas daejeonensis]UNK58754.1 ribonuclease P protein component [Pseudoxanthomonas daejeonensis]
MTSDPRARFPRSARVRLRAEYTVVFEQGRRIGDPLLGLHWVPGSQPPRLGLAVSRKVDPHAVGRNRIKRVLRDATRRVRAQLAGGDYVVVARPAAGRAANAQLLDAYLKLLRRAGALPAPVAGGTMPAATPSDPTHPPIPTSTPDS